MSEIAASRPVVAAVVGTGHLGRHHVRILSQMPGVRFLGAFDADRARLEAITSELGVAALAGVEEAAAAEAVVVATPTVTHREVAGRLLEGGATSWSRSRSQPP